jgi:hypothetical protein
VPALVELADVLRVLKAQPAEADLARIDPHVLPEVAQRLLKLVLRAV